jgi:hypothetical protein
MKVVIETSVLISGSIFWEYEHGTSKYAVRHKHHPVCSALFDILRKLSGSEIAIVTKTVENEAKDTLEKAVAQTIRQTYFPTLAVRYKIMAVQHIVTNDCLDRLEDIVEETSIRLPIDLAERDRIVAEELEPFFLQIVPNTVRYIQPSIPSFIKGDFRGELTDIMVEALPSKGTIYKGIPDPRDYVIMAEATMIYRKYGGKEQIYVASKDNHFKPNPVQIGSYLGKMKFLMQLDATVRDKVAEKFGFIGEDPRPIVEIINAKYPKATQVSGIQTKGN